MKITVKPEWLKACGFDPEDNVFNVIHVKMKNGIVMRTPMGRFFDVLKNGYKWTVAEDRCTKVEE